MTVDSSQFQIERLLEQHKGSVKRNTKNGGYIISWNKNIDSYKTDDAGILIFITNATLKMGIVESVIIVS